MLQGGDGVGGTGCGMSHTSPCVGLRVPLSPRYPRGRTAETASDTAANRIRASLISPRATHPNLVASCLGTGTDGEGSRGALAAPTWGGGSEDGLLSPLQGSGEALPHATNLNCRAGLQPSLPITGLCKTKRRRGRRREKHAARSCRQEPFPRPAAEVFSPHSPISPFLLGFAPSFAQRSEAASL